MTEKNLISALAAELGVVELGLVIQTFQPLPRPLPEENNDSSSRESLEDSFENTIHVASLIPEKSISTA